MQHLPNANANVAHHDINANYKDMASQRTSSFSGSAGKKAVQVSLIKGVFRVDNVCCSWD